MTRQEEIIKGLTKKVDNLRSSIAADKEYVKRFQREIGTRQSYINSREVRIEIARTEIELLSKKIEQMKEQANWKV